VFLALLVLNVFTALGIVKSDRTGYNALVKRGEVRRSVNAQQSGPLIPTSSSILSKQHRGDGSQSRLLPTTACDIALSPPPQISAEPQKLCLRKETHQEHRSPLHGFWSSASHAVAFLCMMGLIATSIMVPINLVYSAALVDVSDSSFCDSGGNFHINSGPSFWAPSQVFEITVSFGNFSFSNAKLIDVIWDVVMHSYQGLGCEANDT
jgi:hypothetical protein